MDDNYEKLQKEYEDLKIDMKSCMNALQYMKAKNFKLQNRFDELRHFIIKLTSETATCYDKAKLDEVLNGK